MNNVKKINPNKGFSLHIRLTNDCNADCSYCSSFTKKPSIMSFRDFRNSLFFIKPLIDKMHNFPVSDQTISINYIGGEILLVNSKELERMVLFARQIFSDYNQVIDGVQSNLIGSKAKIDNLISLFGNRIGTSEETIGKNRTINGNSDIYQSIYKKSENHLKTRNIKAGVIYAVSKDSANDAFVTYKKCKSNSQDFGLRPVFEGGATHQNTSDINHLSDVYLKVLDNWFMSGNMVVEPFFGFINKILNKDVNCNGCPFQNNCTEYSLDLESNGDLFVCMDMADSGQYKIGNAINKEFDYKLISSLGERKESIHKECGDCPYYSSCQGGCMSEAIHSSNSYLKKTPYCPLWTEVHEKIYKLIEKNGTQNVISWIKSLN